MKYTHYFIPLEQGYRSDAQFWDVIATLRCLLDEIMQYEKFKENINISRSQLVLNEIMNDMNDVAKSHINRKIFPEEFKLF